MREAELLYLVAALIYIYECALVLPTTAHVLQRPWRRWRYIKPLILRGGRGPAVAFAAALPPLGPSIRVETGGRLDVNVATLSVRAVARATRHLRVYENLLFFSVFGGGAAMVWADGAPDMSIIVAVVGLWVLCLAAAIDARRVLRAEYRPTWRDLLVAGASPLSAIRLHDVFFKRACPEVDVTAAIIALGTPELAREAMRRALARAKYAADGPLADLEAFARQQGFDPTALDAAPARESAEDVAYCPICLASFSRPDAACSTCDQVAVRVY